MILKVNDITPDIASLLDDDSRDFATDAYLLPKLRVAQRKLIVTMLENPNIGDIKAVIEIFNVPVGTTSLKAAGFMESGQPLELLRDVITLEEKVSGQGIQEYVYLTRAMKLPNVVPGVTNQLYSWIGQDLLLLGATSALDMRFFATFDPAFLVGPTSPLIPGTDAILIYRTAEIVAALRGNMPLSLKYKSDADDAEDQHFNNLIMAQQSIPIRNRAYPRTGYELRYL